MICRWPQWQECPITLKLGYYVVQTRVSPSTYTVDGWTLMAPPGEYDGMINAAAAMRAIATIVVATCFESSDYNAAKLYLNVKLFDWLDGSRVSLSRLLLHFWLEKPPSIEDRCQTDRITTHAGLCRWPRLRYTTYSSPCTANDVTMETYY